MVILFIDSMLFLMNFTLAIISQIVFAGIISIYMGPVPTILVEIFSTSIRFTGDNYAIVYYLIALALLSSIILKFYKDTHKKNLVN